MTTPSTTPEYVQLSGDIEPQWSSSDGYDIQELTTLDRDIIWQKYGRIPVKLTEQEKQDARA